ncbi:MAG: 6,7-dimethyl-8-ribityllumazine synthase [Acidimicrobiales bacterium]
MAGDLSSPDAPLPVLDGVGLRAGVVCGRFNSRITLRLLDGVRRGLDLAGVKPDDIAEVWVPGAFEIPFAAKAMALSGAVDAVVCVGAVIRGETAHFELVAGECARGVQSAQLDTGVPMAFGVLTTEDADQALARSQREGGHNVGQEAAETAVEMVRLLRSLQRPTSR